METIKVLTERRSDRKYDPNYVVPKEDLQKIMKCALNAPTGSNTQGVDFIVITNKEKIQKVDEACFPALSEQLQQRYLKRQEQNGNKNLITYDCTALVLLVQNERAKDSIKVDSGMIAMSIITAAAALGLGTVPLGIICRPEVEEAMGIQKGKLCLGVAIGKALPNEKVPKEELMKITYVE